MSNPHSSPHGLTRVAVVGSGYMGGGIAQVLALGGATVSLGDISADIAQKAYERLVGEAEAYEKAGLFDAGATEVIRANLSPAASIEEAVRDADYITEAVPESREIKFGALARVSAAARADAIIGTNTSAIPINELATSVVNPERFLGVHWMNPA
ncbi:MAG: 3-hydroxybutyryl-CoA dehydrogenase, partial [Subtercola sp.]|nr:3-hydroxybutyryl-CoA dehydrogenase [Subtercola sp.]